MCGINGIYQINKLTNPKELLEEMNLVTKHRGPDYTGTYVDDMVALGHNRLAIIDLQENSNQPFTSDDENLVLIFNGEIYNFEEVRNILTDYPFKTKSDTEVIIAAYKKWGVACINHFNGMFALAIWDKAKQEMFIARDRLGIKPLYYFDNLNQFAFSSEVRSLLTLPFVERRINKDALVDYVQYGTVHAPRTIVDGIKMLLPGHYLVLNTDGIQTKQYWDINLHHSALSYNQTYEKVKETVKTKFFESVESRLKADVPFGAFLSGGIDSSAVVAAMSEVSTKKVKTFNVAFDEEEFSEAKYACQISEKFNTEHHEIKLTPDDFLAQLPDAIKSMDHPSADGPNSYIVSQATKEAGITMALSGLGGDELFAGYDIFKRAYSLLSKKWMMSFPILLRKTIANSIKLAKPSVSSDKIKQTLTSKFLELPYYYPINREIINVEEIHQLLTFHDYPQNAVFEILQNGIGVKSNGKDVPFLSRVSYAEMNTYMQNVLLRDSDQMSMAHALEVRVPFLDHNLVEYVYGINDDIKYPNTQKRLLVDSLGDLLPDEVVNRPKMGFTLPWKTWMKSELNSYCKDGLDYLILSGMFEKLALDELWQQFEKGHFRAHWAKIWQLVVLGHWIQNNEISAD
ncbi:MAG: asparagine synthase (glutamine-hydrolyzing) [Flavobacteriales bacterium]|jgi:asparagine synthase (glutamine-hydrolysing)